MHRGADVFANDIIYGREIAQQKLKHRRHVASVKPTSQTNARDTELDQRMPESLSPRYDHLRYNPKRIEMESEWYHRVNHQNRVLLERMIKISTTNSVLPKDPPRFHDHRQHNERLRRRRLHKVYQENAVLSHRIRNVRPSYPKEEWSRVSARQTRLLKKLSRDRTLGYLSSASQPRHSKNRQRKERRAGPAAGPRGPSNAWGSPRTAAAKAGLYVNLDEVPGGHLWEGPSVQSTRGNWKKKKRRNPRESKQRERLARETAKWNEQQWDTSTSLQNPRSVSYEAAYKKAVKVFDMEGYVPFNAKPSVGFRRLDQMPPALPGGRKKKQRQRQGHNINAPRSYGLGISSVHEELLFQGQKEINELRENQGEPHNAAITVLERTEQTFRDEPLATVDGVHGGGSSLSTTPSMISNAPVHLPVTTQSLGLRVVARLTQPLRSSLTLEATNNDQSSYEVVVEQNIGLRYLIIVLSSLAENSSEDPESTELASVARDVLQKLAERNGDASAQGQSIRGILGSGATETQSNHLLQKFAQLLMHICETELNAVEKSPLANGTEKTLQKVSSCIVVGRRYCKELHEHAKRIQALLRGVMGRARVLHMLNRAQSSKYGKSYKGKQRQHLDRSRSPPALRHADEARLTRFNAPKSKEKCRHQQSSLQPTRPRPDKAKRTFVRPSNRPGRKRSVSKKIVTANRDMAHCLKVPSRPLRTKEGEVARPKAGRNTTTTNSQPNRQSPSQQIVHEESKTIFATEEKSNSGVQGKSNLSNVPAGESAVRDSDTLEGSKLFGDGGSAFDVSPLEESLQTDSVDDDDDEIEYLFTGVAEQSISTLPVESLELQEKDGKSQVASEGLPAVNNEVSEIEEEASLLAELEDLILEESKADADTSLLEELDSMIMQDDASPKSSNLGGQRANMTVSSETSAVLLAELDSLILEDEKTTRDASKIEGEQSSLLAELDSMILDDDVLAKSNSAGQSISMSAVGSKASGEKDMRDASSTDSAKEASGATSQKNMDQSSLLTELDSMILEDEALINNESTDLDTPKNAIDSKTSASLLAELDSMILDDEEPFATVEEEAKLLEELNELEVMEDLKAKKGDSQLSELDEELLDTRKSD